MQAIDDPVLKRFRAELEKAYGETLDRVVLFGSRARGDGGRTRIMTLRCSSRHRGALTRNCE